MNGSDLSSLRGRQPSPVEPAPAAKSFGQQPAGVRSLRVTAPWLDVQAWTATGRDADGNQVRAMGRQREAAPNSTAPGGVAVQLPTGFQGGMALLDHRQACLGRVQLDHFGKPEFTARSSDLEVQVLGPQEIVVDRRSSETRCYLSLPSQLQAKSVVLTSEAGVAQTIPITGRHGVSFAMPARFRGALQVLNADGRPLMQATIKSLGTRSGADVHTTVQAPGHEARVRTTGAMLDISVQPAARLRSMIR